MNIVNASNSISNNRRINFTQSEKVLLISLIEKNKRWIVEYSNFAVESSSVSWKKKSDVWDEIARDFNYLSDSGVHRDVRQLRKCWENFKTRYRKFSRASRASTSLNESESANDVAEGPDRFFGLDSSNLYDRIGALVAKLDQQKSMNSFVVNCDNENFTPTSSVEKSVNLASNELAKLANASSSNAKMNTGSLMSQTDVQVPVPSTSSCIDEEISIVEVTSTPKASNSKHDSTSHFSSSVPSSVQFVAQSNSQTNTKKFSYSNLAGPKRHSSGNNIPKIYLKSQPRHNRARFPPYGKFNVFSQGRPQAVDTEKSLKIRYLRNQIREQDMRMRLMQQRMRLERERHEAVMTLLHKQAAHYENQTHCLQDQLNDDTDLSNDWLMSMS